MSSQPHSYSTMEPILGPSVCLICFQMTDKHILVPSDASDKLFINCNKYLHSTLTKGTLKDIELHNENQMPLCKKCFDSALELTQLSEQLTTIQKDISDLSVAFSMAVFHRRSQVYCIGQSCKTSSIVEFNETCLPPNLFTMNLGDQNVHPYKNNPETDINGLHLHTDISNVKCEASDIQFDNLSGAENPQQSVVNDEIDMQLNKENLDEQCGQSTIEQNQNLASISEMKIVYVTSRNDLKQCADPKDGVQLTMSDLLKSVKMPKIILERINIVRRTLDVSVDNSNQTKCAFRQNNFDETLFKDDEFSVHSCATKSPGDGKLLKCFYCAKTFSQECQRTLHHKTHTWEKTFKCSFCNKRFNTSSDRKRHERIHTGERPFKCSFCNNRFNTSWNLKCHERTHSGEKPFKYSQQKGHPEQVLSLINQVGNQKEDCLGRLKHQKQKHFTGPMELKCSFCEVIFSHDEERANHEKIHRREDDEFKDDEFSVHSCATKSMEDRKQLKCLYSEKTFTQDCHRTLHHKTHTGDKLYKSPKQKFVYRNNQKICEVTHTGKISIYKCPYCEKEFSTLCSFKIHERIHTGEKPFKCSFCNKRFNTSSDRKRHERIHTGERPFKCSFCNNRFNTSWNLKCHERTHRGEKPFKNSQQKDHHEQVSSLISQVGNQKHDCLGHLTHQEQIHFTGAMELKCSFCEMTFSHEEQRANHEEIHKRDDENVNENFIVGF